MSNLFLYLFYWFLARNLFAYHSGKDFLTTMFLVLYLYNLLLFLVLGSKSITLKV